jgi:hypothetical protein
MDAYRGGDMAISVVEVDEPPPRLFLNWAGRGNEREPQKTLQPFLRDCVDRAAEKHASVELQCQKVSYINSATIGCMVDMIHRCESAALPVTLKYDRSSGWQRLSFEALKVLVKGAGRLAVEGV